MRRIESRGINSTAILRRHTERACYIYANLRPDDAAGARRRTTLFGFWKGMAWQIASLASLVVSYFAALRFSEQLAPMFGEQAPLNRFVAMLAIYIGTSFVIWTLFRLVSARSTRCGSNRSTSSSARCSASPRACCCAWRSRSSPSRCCRRPQGEAIVGSQSGRYIVALLDKSHSVFPPEIHQIIDPYLNKIEQRLNPNFQPHGQDMQQAVAEPGAGATASRPQLAAIAAISWPQSQPPQSQPQHGQPHRNRSRLADVSRNAAGAAARSVRRRHASRIRFRALLGRSPDSRDYYADGLRSGHSRNAARPTCTIGDPADSHDCA